MTTRANRIEYIDSLRGIAASAVVIQHIAERLILNNSGGAQWESALFVRSINCGRFGIALFFLISGFVVPLSLRPPAGLARFAISRFFRLYPAYWVSIAAAVFVLAQFAHVHFSPFTILANITMLQTALGQPGIIGPYWTLIIELAFYAASAALFSVGKLGDWRALVASWATLVAASILLTSYGLIAHRYLAANLPLNLSLMFVGAMMRRAYVEHDAVLQKWMAAILALTCVFLSATLLLAGDRTIPLYTPLAFLTGYLGAIAFFWLAVRLRAPANPSLTFLGAISYSLYLFHDICLTVWEHTLVLRGGGWVHAVFALVSILSSIAVAIIVYYGVERPAIGLGRNIGVKFAPRAAPA